MGKLYRIIFFFFTIIICFLSFFSFFCGRNSIEISLLHEKKKNRCHRYVKAVSDLSLCAVLLMIPLKKECIRFNGAWLDKTGHKRHPNRLTPKWQTNTFYSASLSSSSAFVHFPRPKKPVCACILHVFHAYSSALFPLPHIQKDVHLAWKMF